MPKRELTAHAGGEKLQCARSQVYCVPLSGSILPERRGGGGAAEGDAHIGCGECSFRAPIAAEWERSKGLASAAAPVPAADGATAMRGSSVKNACPMLNEAEGSQCAGLCARESRSTVALGFSEVTSIRRTNKPGLNLVRVFHLDFVAAQPGVEAQMLAEIAVHGEVGRQLADGHVVARAL